ncbi:MAG: adenylyltransferase/cytidyltransferase family protein [Bradymonadaceae bacterium]
MKTVAIYPGSFDPPTLGHLSVIRRSARIFDEVIILIAIHPTKESWYSPEERAQMVQEIVAEMENVKVEIAKHAIAGVVAKKA